MERDGERDKRRGRAVARKPRRDEDESTRRKRSELARMARLEAAAERIGRRQYLDFD